jgi:hypothetical protein
MEKEMNIINLEQDFLYATEQYQQLREYSFFMDRVAYTVLIGGSCSIIVLNVRVSSEEKSDDSKPSCYEELEMYFYHFS